MPGLDFANHSPQGAQCWWEVVAPENGSSKSRSKASSSSGAGATPASAAAPADNGVMVQLQLRTGASVSKGAELFISYGDKSNEELLLLHGFVVDNNPADHLMLHCPLPPPAEWDDLLHARMELLQVCGAGMNMHSAARASP